MSGAALLTDCGLPGTGRIHYGLHACHFYPHRDQLVEALVAYFLAGLYNREKCLWIAAPPLPAAQALEAIRAAWPGVEKALLQGALHIIDFADWYGELKVPAGEVVSAWLKAEEQALAEGYRGLRVTGNTSFVKPADWAAFMEYEQQVTLALPGRRIVALCSYDVASCSSEQAVEVMHRHQSVISPPVAP